jgi:hypothetical protein
MITVLDALAFGLMPDTGCPECRRSPADRCFVCKQGLTRVGAVNAAMDAVETAPTEAEALAAYQACLTELVGGA